MVSKEHEYTLSVHHEDEYELYYCANPSETPEVSVIISTYNRFRKEGECESLIKRALNSILNQTFKNFEIILIDDCSSDETKNYCIEAATEDPRIRFYHFKKNSGVPAKRYNYGISVSRGKYISFMFDDDQWELHCLERLYQAIEQQHSHCAMVYGLATLYSGAVRENFETLGDPWSWNKIHSHNFISNNSVIIKRDVFGLVGGYDEHPIFYRVCDWDLWWRIGRKFSVARVEERVAIVYSNLPDSIGLNRILDWESCKKRQRSARPLPLQTNQKEPLRCKIHALLFDTYTDVCLKSRPFFQSHEYKRLLKKIIPHPLYQFLKTLRK